jgi:hypothetical protein
MSNNTLTYTINLNGNITNGVLNISNAATQATGKLEKLTKTATAITNIGFAFQHAAALVGKFTAAMDKCVQAYNVQAVAEKKLETLMRNSMSATDAQIQSIKDLTSAQQKLGVIGDEVQLSGAQELSTYLTKTDSLKKLIPAMNDMLAQQYGLNATQEQAVTIAQMMGKVLDGQVGALSRYGYRFDEAQEKVLKFGNEEQKVSMLSGILTKYVGGVNAALAATPEGKWKQHQNAVGDLRERIGKLFVTVRGALMPIFNAISELAGRITAFFENNMATVEKIGALIGGTLVVALNVAAGTLGVILDIASGLFSTMVDYFPYILGATGAYLIYLIAINKQFVLFTIKYYAYHTAVKIATFLTKLWAAATKSVFGVLGLVITAVTVAVSLFKLFRKGQDEATKAVNGVAAKIGIETSNLNKLFEAMKKTEPASERRKNLIDEINAKYPGLLKNQDLYRASIDKITVAQTEANKALASNIFLKDYQENVNDVEKKISDAKQKLWEKLVGEGYEQYAIKEAIDLAENSIRNPIVLKVLGRDELGREILELPHIGMDSISNEANEILNEYSRSFSKFEDEVSKGVKKINALSLYGTGYLGLTPQQLINAVHTGAFDGASLSGGTTPLGNTNEAIATGGTRSTTINISMKNMMEAHFNGTTRENSREVERNLAEAIYKVLGMAETAVS